MNAEMKPSARDIRRARDDNPKMRERDLAARLGVSEAELVAAFVGEGARRIEPRVGDLLHGLGAVGEVMALTRNTSAVHEKIGVYDKVDVGEHAALVLGADIDLRIFPKVWAHGFAVEKRDGGGVRRSLQFFDRAGDAVHKVHLLPGSSLDAYEGLVATLLSADRSQALDIPPEAKPAQPEGEGGSREELRARWSAMTDVHQFFGMLRALGLGRRQAVEMVGDDYAWPLGNDVVPAMFDRAVEDALPIMCFVGNRGCVQIHSGPVRNVAPMGPWLNVADPTFHLHLRLDHVREVWAVRKPTSDGHVTSVEAYDADNELIVQFFGQRHEGESERADWRGLVEALPRTPRRSAA